MLTLAPTLPEWIVLFPGAGDRPEVAVEFEPITIRAVRAARRAAGLALDTDREDIEEAGDELSRELIRRGIRAWRGIGDVEGKVVPVTPETISAFLADPRTYEAADQLYVLPWMARDREGNVSSASPSGTGQVETSAADIAITPATGEPTDDAEPTPPPAPVKPAPTSPTRRRRKKGSASGT